MRDRIISLIAERNRPLLDFWLGNGSAPADASIEAHCDVVYSYYLLGMADRLSASALDQFTDILRKQNLPGWRRQGDSAPLTAHNCAYAFGALNLIAPDLAAAYDKVLGGRELALDDLVDPATKRPVFPPKWAHHSWRVSHWIGGCPSIIVSVARSGSAQQAAFSALVGPVREATNGYIVEETGRLRTWNSDIAQALFRLLYAIRHDPELGDLGGVAHILWVDHALGKRYVGLESLYRDSQRLFRGHDPFMEKVPYCLDFDIVNIVRTAQEQLATSSEEDRARALKMMKDIEAFYAADVSAEYTLHKIPGALATYHECAMLAGKSEVWGAAPIDVIKKAYWL